MSDTVKVRRKTKETDIQLSLNLYGKGDATIDTGVPFLDHMLVLFAVHGFFDLEIKAEGDLHVDYHHTVEDVGICLGQAVSKALGEVKGINRYGSATVPMEEALAHIHLDICKRPYLCYKVHFPTSKIGTFDTELVEEFIRAFAVNSGITIHIHLSCGGNSHHISEAIFKAMGRALDIAVAPNVRLADKPLSSKGKL